jgi:enterobactin synthetase component D
MFATAFADVGTGAFVETTFAVDALTLHRLAQRYAVPDSLRRAVLKRQIEFLAGRVCAQQAIEHLTGHKPASLPSRPDRAPDWPLGIVGAITHTAGYAAALVALATHYQGIGIDCEVVLNADNLKLQRHICVPNELEDLQAAHRTWPPELLLTLVFSAKESLYKCLYPQVQKYFGFCAARLVTLDVEQRTFVIQLEQDLHPNLRPRCRWTGCFMRCQHLLMTAILYAREE